MFDWTPFVKSAKSVTNFAELAPVEKANLVVSDFSGAGVNLPAQVADTFLVQAILTSVLLGLCSTKTYNVTTYKIPSAQFTAQILYAGTEGQAVPANQRSKPTFSQATLSMDKLYKGQVRIDDGVFEDNPEREGLRNTIMGMLTEGIGRDVENCTTNADTTITTNTLLSQTDGLLKRITSHVVSGSGTSCSKTELHALFKKLPKQYRKDPRKLEFFTSANATEDYWNSLMGLSNERSDTRTTEGSAERPKYNGKWVNAIPLFPDDQTYSGQDKYTSAVVMDPKNLHVGFLREVKIEPWRDYDAGQVVFNVSVKFDTNLAFEHATAKHTAIAST